MDVFIVALLCSSRMPKILRQLIFRLRNVFNPWPCVEERQLLTGEPQKVQGCQSWANWPPPSLPESNSGGGVRSFLGAIPEVFLSIL